MTDTAPLEVSVHVAAPPETVFPYFTDPDRYTRWMGRDATLEATPGGTYRVGVRDGMAAAGTFVEVDPPRRVVFTWGWEGDPLVPPGSTRVEVTLTPVDDGTLVRLVHHDLPSPEAVDHHRVGWEGYLPRLQQAATGGDPGPDPNTAG